MKVHVEIDCTPEEARRFMGLPDVGKANEVYVEHFAKAMKGVTDVNQLQDYAKQMAPMGQVGLNLFKSFMEAGAANMTRGSGDKGSKKKPSKDKD